MFLEYIFILKYFFVCFIISSLLFALSFFAVYQKPDLEKLSAYECGFNPFSDARSKFEIKFYLIGILFIIFDLEIVFLYPYILVFDILSISEHSSLICFLYLLTVGFFYEWIKGALDWD